MNIFYEKRATRWHFGDSSAGGECHIWPELFADILMILETLKVPSKSFRSDVIGWLTEGDEKKEREMKAKEIYECRTTVAALKLIKSNRRKSLHIPSVP
jgi:hypothetical protein